MRLLRNHPGKTLLCAWLIMAVGMSAIAIYQSNLGDKRPLPAVVENKASSTTPEVTESPKQPQQESPQEKQNQPNPINEINDSPSPIKTAEQKKAVEPIPLKRYTNKEFEKAVLGKLMPNVISLIGSDYELIIAPEDRPSGLYENPVRVTLMYRGRNGDDSVAFIRFTQQVAVKVDFVN